MRNSGSRFRRVLAGAVGVGLLAGATSQAATYSNNFDTDAGDIVLTGSAVWKDTGGATNTGFISITDNIDSQQGAVILPDFTSGELVNGFKATFKVHISSEQARPADGFAFAFGSGVDDGANFGEEGPGGAALIVCFDTWDNAGTDTAPAIDVKLGGNADANIVATTYLTGVRDGSPARAYGGPISKDANGNDLSLLTPGTNNFAEVSIEVKDSLLNVYYKGAHTVTNVPVIFPPTVGRFAFGGRTGGAHENAWFDNISLETYAITPGLAAFTALPSGFTVKLNDASGETVDLNSVTAKLNGTTVTLVKSKTGDITTATYTAPSLLASGSINAVDVTFSYGTPAKTKTIPLTATIPAYVVLDAADAVPDAKVNKNSGGFTALMRRAPAGTGLANTTARVEGQLRNTLLVPGTILPYEDLTDPLSVGTGQTNVAGKQSQFTVDVLNMDQQAADAGIFTSASTTYPYPEVQFPGEDPGLGADVELNNMAGEFITYLELPQGLTRLGVNSDDGFKVTIGSDPRSPSAKKVGEFEGGRGSDGTEGTLFYVYASTAGVYPTRVIWYEGGGGANLEFYSKSDDDTRHLVNDRADAKALKGYLSTTGFTASTPAYLAGSSVANGDIVKRDAAFRLQLTDSGTTVAPASLKLSFDGALVTPVITKTDADTVIVYDPDGLFNYGSPHTLSLVWSDNGSPANNHTNSWAFNVGGGVIFKRFEGISGGNTSDLLNSDSYKNNTPELVTELPSMEYPDQGIDNYGGELLAYFTPDHNDTYTFYISADDGCALYISTDESPINKTLVASNGGNWSGTREWVVNTSNAADPVAQRKSPPIALVAGKKYFLQALQKEGGGGDHLEVAFSDLTTKPVIVNGDAPISTQLSPFTGDFDVLPLARTNNKGTPASFSARFLSPTGDPITYQWFRNGTAVAGATDATYVNPAVTFPGDNGAKYKVTATSGTVAKTSPEVILTVNDDTTAPVITVAAATSTHSIQLSFNEPLVGASATVVGNYTLSGGVTVSAISGSGANYTLTTTQPLLESTTYTLTVNGVADGAGNIAANATKSFKPSFGTGFVKVERFDNIGGTAVSLLTDAQSYIDGTPDATTYLPSLDYRPNLDNYGARLSGYIVPATSGDYRFFISSDDASQFFLSTDDSPANLSAGAIAEETGCCKAFLEPEDPTEPSVTSAPITLVGGSRYYFVALVKEGGGGDYISVAWRKEGDTTPAASLQPIGGSSIGSFADPAGHSVVITTNPVSVSVIQNTVATFTGAAQEAPAGGGLGYQWQRKAPADADFSNIAGATRASFTTPKTTLAMSGTQYRLVASTVGGISATSTVATLTVSVDNVAPTAKIGSVKRLTGVEIGVAFSEDIDVASGLTTGNYVLSKGTITGARIVGTTSVVLTTTGLADGDSFTLTVTGVKDQFNNPMAATPLTGKVSPMRWVQVGANKLDVVIDPDVVASSDKDFDLYSGGNGFWGTYDEAVFVYETVTGDFDRKVRVEYQDPSSQWARCGLIARVATDELTTEAESAADKPMSQHQMIFVDPSIQASGAASNNSFEANRRLAPGGATDSLGLSGTKAPPYPNAWIRIARVGNTLTVYRSDDGVTWVQMGSEPTDTGFVPALPSTLLVGMTYSPENGNIADVSLRKQYMAKFREYGPVTTGGAPATITATLSGTVLNIAWTPAGGTLQSADSVTGPWTDVGTANPAAPITANTAAKFYRIKN